MQKLVPLVHPFLDASRAPIYVMEFSSSTTDDELKACCVAREEWAQKNFELGLKYFSYSVARRKLAARLANLFGEGV